MYKIISSTLTLLIILIVISITTFFADVETWADKPYVTGGSLKQYKVAKKRALKNGLCTPVWSNKKHRYIILTDRQCKNY